MKAYTHPHLAVGRNVLVLLCQCLLYRKGTRKPVGNARELGEHRVSSSVGDPPAMLADQSVDDRTAGGEGSERAVFIGAHQPTVLDDIGSEDRRQPPFHPLRHPGSLSLLLSLAADHQNAKGGSAS
jgi:hypothetical protein